MTTQQNKNVLRAAAVESRVLLRNYLTLSSWLTFSDETEVPFVSVSKRVAPIH